MAREATGDVGSLRPARHTLRMRSWQFVIVGALMALLGVIAMIYAGVTTALSVMFLGAVLLIGGVIEIAHSFTRSAGWGSFFLDMLAGVLYLVAGGLILANPAVSAAALTLLIAMVLVVAGVFRIISALTAWPPVWGWVLVHGIIGAGLGLLLWSQWPLSGMVFIGLVIGIELLLNGVTLLMLGFMARSLPIGEAGEQQPPSMRKAA